MSIQLQPRQNFAIVRQLPDPSDSATYYVQAEIRYAATDVLITRVNLTDKTSRRFVGIWAAVADKSGQGTLVSIRTTVYTDSGYTTKSTNYAEEMETYLILERFNPNQIVAQLGPALGGPDISYKKIQEIVYDVLTKKLEAIRKSIEELGEKIPTEKQESLDGKFQELKDAIANAAEDVKISMPEYKDPELDFTPIASILDKEFDEHKMILQKIVEKVSEEEQPIDLTPITESLERLEAREEIPEETLQKLDDAMGRLTDLFDERYPGMMEEANKLLDKLRDAFMYSMATNSKEPKKDPAESPFSKRALELATGIKTR